ncbi:MAG: hypothetical protein NTW60_03975 [Candidatus Wolfebacteria bacterium]|nr:hypothetical protein [Candidatus Wolfebacteria bacterium]
MAILSSERIWRILTNIWTGLFIIFLVADFTSKNRFEYLIAPFSVIYIGILGLYVGTKEFDRWYEFHEGRHPGEWFVILWTVLVFGLLGASISLGGDYKVSSEAIADYIMVLSVFALTQKSKSLHKRRLEQKRRRA